MVEFLLNIGYSPPETFPKSNMPNPRVALRESEPREMTYHYFALKNSSREVAVILVTNSLNDVVNAKFHTVHDDMTLSQYFEVNSAHDRSSAKEFIAANSR